ncbi:MAG: hypothetical protein AMJ81_14635 [Phycisphaerae bacterium SM23_33]|nr:MAG: hypothetical protein AMJ81_14635 [Phycisphaerae bacterium SM23_33]
MALPQLAPPSSERKIPPENFPSTALLGTEQYRTTSPVAGSAPPHRAWIGPGRPLPPQSCQLAPRSAERSSLPPAAAYQNACFPPAGGKKNETTCSFSPPACVQVSPSSSLRKVPLAELTSSTSPPGPMAGSVDCGVACCHGVCSVSGRQVRPLSRLTFSTGVAHVPGMQYRTLGSLG